VWRTRLLLLLLVAAPWPRAQAEPAAGGVSGRFDAGLKAYWEGRHDEALAAFDELWTRYQLRSPELAYNLGVVHLARGDNGRAVYALRQAADMAPPADLREDVQRALAKARGDIARRYERDVHRQQLVHGRVTGLLHDTLHALPTGLWAWGVVAAAAAFTLLFGLGRGRERWTWRLAIGMSLLVLACSVAGWSGRVAQDGQVRIGVLLEGVQLREALDPAAPSHPIPPTTELRVLDEAHPRQLRVQLPTGRKGWVPRDKVGLL
jgi:hypothetical protein